MGLLDFQDAHAGPAAYDLVSLVQDARRDVGPDAAAASLDRFLSARSDVSRSRLEAALAILGSQRALRILGVLARLEATRGRTFPPGLIERVRRYLAQDLQHPVMERLRAWCVRHYPATGLIA